MSREARHDLVMIALQGIRKELADTPISHNSRGRPRSIEAVLAARLGVHQKTVKRWIDLEDFQACDSNSESLFDLAYDHDPDATTEAIYRDMEKYRQAIQLMIENKRTHPCPTNQIEKPLEAPNNG